MGGNQTYDVSCDSLAKAMIGLGAHSCIPLYFFIDK